MPKETVYDRSAQYDLKVGWSQDADVQVGVETADYRTIIDKLAGDASPELRAFLDKMYASHELPAFTGLWATLDRKGCNRLIRVLRRARDQAFGADA